MSGALEGVRIIDLTRVWAGPLAVRMLADLGAEVIKVEGLAARGMANVPPSVGKMLGVYADDDTGEHPWNRHALFNDFNRNKFGITLELNTHQGAEILKRLVKISDIIIDNYTPRVMPNFGLGYDILRRINPSIVMVSMPGFGMTGPYRDYMALGTTLEPASGMSSLMGYRGGPPHISGNAYPDPVASLNAAAAVLVALWHREQTGEGQFVDVAQIEGTTCLIGEAVLGYAMTKEIPERMGNRDISKAPQGCYRCRGDDRWIAIAVSSDEEWEALCCTMGGPPWAKDERFSDQLSRRKNQDELDRLLETWTIQHDHYEIMYLLQGAGVPAGAALDAKELVTDAHLQAAGFFWDIDEREAGRRIYAGLPIRLSTTPAQLRLPAPCLGEHNEYVLGEILGLPKEDISQLESDGIIGTVPTD